MLHFLYKKLSNRKKYFIIKLQLTAKSVQLDGMSGYWKDDAFAYNKDISF